MEEQLVSFETAKLAKEKGFDINVNYFISQYSKDGGIVFSESVESDNYNSSNWNTDVRISLLSRTTQSLLAKWLREVHNFHISINVGLPHKAHIMYYSNVIKFGKEHKSKYRSVFYKTYEEALEIGLQEALKLVKS